MNSREILVTTFRDNLTRLVSVSHRCIRQFNITFYFESSVIVDFACSLSCYRQSFDVLEDCGSDLFINLSKSNLLRQFRHKDLINNHRCNNFRIFALFEVSYLSVLQSRFMLHFI
jgi:hypothetical protein